MSTQFVRYLTPSVTQVAHRSANSQNMGAGPENPLSYPRDSFLYSVLVIKIFSV